MNRAEARKLMEFYRKTNAKTVDRLTSDMTVVCARLEGFDFQRADEFWEMPENKCLPTNVRCKHCGEPVTMSLWMHTQYLGLETKPPVVCVVCLAEQAKEDK